MTDNLKFATGNSGCQDDGPANCEACGRMCNRENAMKACPDGWRVVSMEEWNADSLSKIC